MKRKFWFGAVFLAATIFVRAATNDLSATLQRGLFEEEANHNYDAASQAYQSVIAQHDKDRKLVATAVFRLGEIYLKQGKTNEAVAQYQRVAREFADQTTLHSLSLQNLAQLRSTPSSLALPQPPTADFAQRLGQIMAAATNRTIPDRALRQPESFEVIQEDSEINRLKNLIKDSPDLVNAKDSVSGRTPLHDAARKGQLKVVEFLLANGADKNVRDNGGWAALQHAVSVGNRALVELLLTKGVEVDAGDWNGQTPLHLAALRGFKNLVEILLANKADVNAKRKDEATPLHLAAANGFKSVAETLIAARAGVNADAKSMRLQIDGGTSAFSGSPLHVAIARGDRAMVELLLSNKANVNLTSSAGETPLHTSIGIGNLALTELLLKAGASANPTNGWLPLLTAVGGGNKEIVRLLLKNKANPNVTDSEKKTPLHYAIMSKSREIVDLLLASGADVNAKDIAGNPPLNHAVDLGEKEIVEALLAHKADVNYHNEGGYTALHYAVMKGRKEIVELLLANGADPNIVASDGKTPLYLAKLRQPPLPPIPGVPTRSPKLSEIAEALRKHGAQEDLPDFSSIRVTRAGLDQPRTVFRRDTNAINRFTLLEVLRNYYPEPAYYQPNNLSMSFPDFSKIIIYRPLAGKAGGKKEITVNLLTVTNSFDCSKDMWLEFGDVVEIPEREHTLAEQPIGLTVAQHAQLKKCLAGFVTFVVRGEKAEARLDGTGSSSRLQLALGRVQNLLRSSSDLSRIKINRTDPITKKPLEIIANSRLPQQDNVWLRDGDVIEVPDKPNDSHAEPARGLRLPTLSPEEEILRREVEKVKTPSPK